MGSVVIISTKQESGLTEFAALEMMEWDGIRRSVRVVVIHNCSVLRQWRWGDVYIRILRSSGTRGSAALGEDAKTPALWINMYSSMYY